jgi:alkylation response protein AidB-like acyl-CoA dehydrogenase
MSSETSWRDRNTMPMDEFRTELRAFIRAHFPEDLREGFHHPMGRLRGDRGREWVRTMFRHGWRCPHWPVEHGGLGLSVERQLFYLSEMDEYGVTRILDFGGQLLGPQLIRWGTPEQQAEYLPGILSGDALWAQGFSEPGSGSDLASLSTRAVLEGDEWVVNGSKIWTTQAADADKLFLLVRTSTVGRKQEGISFLLTDIRVPGITISPIRNIQGEEEFYQVFFDNLRIPAGNVLGDVNKGWNVAKTLLGVERLHYGNPIPARRALELARQIARLTGQADDPALSAKFADVAADIHDLFCLYREVADTVAHGGQAEAEMALLKVYGTELHQRAADLVIEAAGGYAAIDGRTIIGDLEVNISRLFRWVRAPTIFGGTSEVQRNILTRQFLGKA